MSPCRSAAWTVPLGFLVASLVLGAGEATSQQWELELGAGGVAHEGLASRVTSQSAILGLRYAGSGWFYLSAGAPLESAGIPWGAAGAGRRFSLPVSRVWIGADMAGHGHAYREPTLDLTGSGFTGEALPFIGSNIGPAWLELHSGLLHHTTAFSGETEARTLHDSGISLSLPATPQLSLRARARYARAPEGEYPFAGASATYNGAFGSAWIHAGKWLSDDIPDPIWGVGANLTVAGRYSIRVTLEQETNDPLYWNAPRRSWNVALSRRIGGPLRSAAEAPPPPPQVSAGEVTIRLPLSDAPPAAAPSVAGDFTGWEALPMELSGGEWSVRVRLEPGIYRYAFRHSDGSWFVPESAPGRIDDGFGGESILLIVR